jgi:O-antigen biosynthesis protein
VNLLEKIGWYYRNRGLRALVARALTGQNVAEAHSPRNVPSGAGAPAASSKQTSGSAAVIPAREMLLNQYRWLQPLPVYTAPGPDARLNLITDSINVGSLFGGVGTAIIIATLLAKQRGAKLRVITRVEEADEGGFAQVLKCNGIEYDDNVEFVFVGVGDRRAQLDICEGDRFLTTSWWTTAATLGSIPANRVDYLLQEDERMFYPHGDDWLRCEEVLLRKDIRFIINTKMLYNHLLGTGLAHLKDNAKWFEPAFSDQMFPARRVSTSQGKRKLFFYARPNNLRNLFYRGVEVLDTAVTEGLISPDKWDVIFVGKDIPKIRLGGKIEPKILPTMGWKEYGEFITGVDVGVCLMSTPHPSYPPLDLARAGALVLTNRFGIKTDLSHYSANITCVEPSVKGLLEGLRSVLQKAEQRQDRAESLSNHTMSNSWQANLADVIEYLK